MARSGRGERWTSQTLDNGEAEAIALATELQPEVVLLDDKLAGRMARRLGVPVTGTLGVLLRAKQLGLVVELRSLIIRLQSEGDYYITYAPGGRFGSWHPWVAMGAAKSA